MIFKRVPLGQTAPSIVCELLNKLSLWSADKGQMFFGMTEQGLGPGTGEKISHLEVFLQLFSLGNTKIALSVEQH